jgi:hypothetical protein
VDRVKAVVDLGVSRDGQARQALVQVAVVSISGGPEAKAAVDAMRSTFAAAGAPAGLRIHLTGQLASQVDTVAATGSSQNQTAASGGGTRPATPGRRGSRHRSNR